ncbi:RNA polymerase sigma factor RpoD [Dickeya solani]|nr:RNA polymerase sigma factor RpoD [Dickeya solani]NUA44951.1 RNA polymerase sigma factor RpoD [Dickeya solani]NUA47429.1 RNA polymerase sigma factor RpoD [Dickeya solani]QKO12338.1 RNA polymerase sigma factor RpoD [Dickeya solani]QKO16749.1 RNA polymerase sigma factor RpoD [Dickeya solani]
MEQNPQSQLKLLVTRGKEQGYLTYAEVNDHLPEDIIDSDQIEDIIQMINDMGIQVMEEAPDADDLMLAENTADEDAAEAAAQVLSSVESEIGRTTDPVRMYMREMGTVELLTREGEIDIAKRIEDGINQVQCSVAEYPEAITYLLDQYDRVEAGESRLSDLITAFVDPNAEEDLAPNPPRGTPSRPTTARMMTTTKTKKTKTTAPTMTTASTQSWRVRNSSSCAISMKRPA